MRFGLMFKYPDMNAVNATGGSNAPQYKVGEKNKDHTGQVDENQTKISIFSAYDTNHDEQVTHKEVDSLGKFVQTNVDPNSASALNNVQESFKAKVQTIAINSFKPKMGKIFSNFVAENFKTQTAKKLEVTGNDAQSKGTKYDDSAIETEIKRVTEMANKAVQDAYNNAVTEAIQNYDKANNLQGDEILTGDEMESKLTAKNKKGKDVSNVEITKTAYSTYDGDTNGEVKGNEIRFQKLDSSRFTKVGFTTELNNAIKQDVEAFNNISQDAFSVTTGKETFTGKTEKEVNKQVQDFAKKADKKVDKEVKQFTKQLEKDLQTQVDKTIAASGQEGGVEGRQRPINTTSGSDKIAIVPNGNGYSATFNGKPANYTADEKGGGKLTFEDTEKSITIGLDSSGNVISRTETESTSIPTTNEGETGTKTTTTKTEGDKTETTVTNKFTSNDGAINRSLTFINDVLNEFTFTPNNSEGTDAPKPVNVSLVNGQPKVIGEDGKEIKDAKATDNKDGTYTVEVNGKKYTVTIDEKSGDLKAEEVKEPDTPKDKFENWNYNYTIKAGDTLSGIAKKCGNGVTYNDIQAANKEIIQNPNRIYAGKVIRLPKEI